MTSTVPMARCRYSAATANRTLPIQTAFHQACIAAGFREVEDMNGPGPYGLSFVPMNNPQGIRMSTALTHLNPVQHRLNLTIRGNVLARRVIFEGKKAVGVEVESDGEVFVVEGEQIVLTSGGIRTPHLLMLSGVGPADQLRAVGIPVVHDSLGVGQNLKNHPSASVTLRAKRGVALNLDITKARLALRYTATGSSTPSDMMLMTNSIFSTLSGDPMPEGIIRISCALELPASMGEVRIVSADPNVQPYFNYHYLEDPWDRERLREGVRLCRQLVEASAYQDIVADWVSPTEDETERRRQARRLPVPHRSELPCTTPVPAAWGRSPTRWRWPTSSAESAGLKTCGWPTVRCCQTLPAPIPTPPPSWLASGWPTGLKRASRG